MTGRLVLPEVIEQQRVIAVMRRLGLARVQQVAPVLLEAGIGIFEVTLDDAEALEGIRWLVEQGYVAAAGTVLSIEQAEGAIAAGASFIVSPVYDAGLVEWSLARSIAIVPGALTPGEIAAAWAGGATAVKLFPASLGGPRFLAAVRGPLAHIPLIPTGGITDHNAAAFLEAGAVAVGVGGWLTAGDDLAEIRRRAMSLVESVPEPR
jgi:2-dehydro-3-deoxyphosphogluconate aldolase/(4S)-4-hydroxy-2-oxoglutarate aldolase